MGARGPIVVYAIFVVGYFVFFRQYNKYALLKRGIAITLFAAFYYYMELIILAILPIAMTLGFSTRVFDSILDDKMVNMEESSNRDNFYASVIEEIKMIMDLDMDGFQTGCSLLMVCMYIILN